MGLFGVSLSDITGGAKKTAGTIYDYATPGSGSSRLTDSGSRNFAPATPTYSVSSPKKTAAPAYNGPSYDASAYSQSATNALIAAIMRMGNAQPRQVYAPALDFASINASARSQAESAVNPYYTKELQRFLSEQAAHKQQAEAMKATTITNLEEDLKNKVEANAITQQRTGEDVATNLGEIAQQEDQYQTDTGQKFEGDRILQAREAAKAGLTGGIGAQQAESAQAARNTAEERQGQQTQAAKDKQNLFKARTFEDLSRSNVLGTQAKERGAAEATTTLADFITNQGFETEKTTSALEKSRLEELSTKERAYRGLGVASAIEAIADPAQRNAARGAYSGYL